MPNWCFGQKQASSLPQSGTQSKLPACRRFAVEMGGSLRGSSLGTPPKLDAPNPRELIEVVQTQPAMTPVFFRPMIARRFRGGLFRSRYMIGLSYGRDHLLQ